MPMQPQPIHSTQELEQASHKLAAENARYRDELARLREALQERDERLGHLSHQLRTPLAAISGYGALLQSRISDSTGNDYLSRLLTAADSLMAVVRDLPDSNRHEFASHPRPCNPAALMPQLDGFFAYEAQRKGLAFRQEWDKRIPQGLYCDTTLLRQVLLVLVHNAIRYTDAGGVRVEVTLERISDNEAQLMFAIEDTGEGIAEARLPTLFTPPPPSIATAPRFGRAGQSLYQATRAVRAMGGELAVTSTEGQGSRFAFSLAFPIQYPAVLAAEQSQPTPPSYWRERRVLVVDDDTMSRELLVTMARGLGIGHVDSAADGEEAVAQAGMLAYDLVLMDCQMPRMDGFAATRALRRKPRTAHLPIIGITADVIRADTAKCYAAGMDDYYHKPLSRLALEQVLHRWLSPREASAV